MPGQDAPSHQAHHGLVAEERHVGQQPDAEKDAVGPGENHEHPGHDVRRGHGDATPVRARCDVCLGRVAGTRRSRTGFREGHAAIAAAGPGIVGLRSWWGELLSTGRRSGAGRERGGTG